MPRQHKRHIPVQMVAERTRTSHLVCCCIPHWYPQVPKAEHNRITILNHFTDGSTKSINSEYFCNRIDPISEHWTFQIECDDNHISPSKGTWWVSDYKHMFTLASWLHGTCQHMHNQAHRHSNAATTTTTLSLLSTTHTTRHAGTPGHKFSHNWGQADDDLINRIAIFPSSAMWYVVLGRHIEVPSTNQQNTMKLKTAQQCATSWQGEKI